MSIGKKTDFTRRNVLTASLAGAGLALTPNVLRAAAARMPENPKQAMRRRAIPGTDEQLPVVGMGSSGSFESVSSSSAEALKEVMREFVRLGGELLDTSPTYGNAETNIAEMAKALGLRDQLFMATKVNAPGAQAGKQQMARSRELLDPIDLMQVHNLVELEAQWPTLKAMQADGAVRYIGFTHYQTYAFDDLARHMQEKAPDFVQLNYSIMTPQAEKRLLPLARDQGIAVLANRNFNDGQFFGQVKDQPLPDYAAEIDCHSWAQFALKYVLGHPAVTGVIPATSKPKHLRDNMQAGYGALPDADLRKRMRKTLASL